MKDHKHDYKVDKDHQGFTIFYGGKKTNIRMICACGSSYAKYDWTPEWLATKK